MTAVEPPQPGEVLRIEVGDRPVAVWNVGGRYHAIGDVCPHRGWILSEGSLERHTHGKLCVVCPGHNWRFDLETGESLASPETVEVFDVVETHSGIEVVPRAGPRRAG